MNRKSHWYSMLMERCYDGIAIIDQSHQVLDANQRCADMLGYSMEEMRQLHIWDWEALMTEAEIRSRFADFAKTNCVFETRHRRKDGKLLDVEVSASGAMVEGEVMVFTVVRDISERKKQRQALEHEKAFSETVLESLPGICYLYQIDPQAVENSRLVRFNKNHATQTGYSEAELLGKRVRDWFDDTNWDIVRKRLEIMSKEGMSHVQAELTMKTGQQVPFEFTGRMLQMDGVPYFVGMAVDVSDYIHTQNILRQEREFTERLLDSLPGIFYLYDSNLKLRRWNHNHETDTGFSAEEMMGRDLADWHASEESKRAAVEASKAVLKSSGHGAVESPLLCKDGSSVHYLLTGVRFDGPDGPMLMGVGVNITERKRVELEREKLQEQLLQAQKMESVGRLAGGVAHDFNNMLQTILGNVELTQECPTLDQATQESLEEIRLAAERSADLTRQLLAFARKQTVAPRVLSLDETVEGTLKMLRRLIGEDIDLAWKPARDLWLVKVDPVQIDQILANLCVNARDAIAGVGKLTIEINNCVFDAEYCANHANFIPGEYVMLGVSDDGCGIGPEVLEHIFEPFFTTKGQGQGTGLGLATVYGIVKQNNGFINVYSEPGKGTTFKIYLPRHEGDASATAPALMAEASQAQGETVLLVEDEISVLNLGRRLLEQLGYVVICSNHPGEALQKAAQHAGPIHLLITDVVMPEMNGRELAQRLQKIRPGIKCLFMSGYTANVIAHRGVLDEGVQFLPKPFSMTTLAAKVRSALQTPDPKPAAPNPITRPH